MPHDLTPVCSLLQLSSHEERAVQGLPEVEERKADEEMGRYW